jgi:hypothetical protein
VDFVKWDSPADSAVLLLSAPSECHLDQVSTEIITDKKNTISKDNGFTLYFFTQSVTSGKSIESASIPALEAVFIHTIVDQIVRCSPGLKGFSIMQCFLYSLLEEFLKQSTFSGKWRAINENGTRDERIKRFLHAPTSLLWSALISVLKEVHQQSLFLLIDGLHNFGHVGQTSVAELVGHLQQRQSEAKILLTRLPNMDNKDVLGRLDCLQIEYDKERKGNLRPFFRS